MSENNFNSTVKSLFQGVDSIITTKTVVGDAIHIGDTIILPLIEVSFGVAAGAFATPASNNSGGGLGGKIIPSAVLVIQNGTTKLVNVKNQDGVTKVLDMVPDFVNKFVDLIGKDKKPAVDPQTRAKAAEAMEELLNESVANVNVEE